MKVITILSLLIALVAGTLFTLSGCQTTKKFDQSAHGGESNIASQAGKYWKKDGWWSLKKKTGRVMITEFSVEYITETETYLGHENQLGLLLALDVIGIGDSRREYDENFKRNFPTKLYQQFTAALEAEGFSVIPMNEVTSHTEFEKIAGAKAGVKAGAGDRSWGPIGSNTTDKYNVYPTPGLPTVDDSWFKGTGNAQAENKVAKELGADVALRVRIRCGVDDDGYAVLSKGSTIRVQGDFKSADAGMMGTTYWAQTNGLVVGKQGFHTGSPVATKEDFRAFEGDIYKVDTKRFGASVLEMFPTYARMGIYTMKR